MASVSQNLILKVLSGAQFGVEVGLSDGEYTFGSGPDADIQFTDLSMSPLHGALRIGSGKVELKAVNALFQTASGLVIEPGGDDWREVAQLDQVTAGTSVFAVGARDAKWSTVAAILPPAAGSAPGAARAASTGSRLPAVIAALAVVAACVFGVLYLTGTSQNLQLAPRLSPDQEFVQVEEALEALPFVHTLEPEMQADGIIFVAGHVTDAAERRAVQNALRETGAQVRPRIWALDAMRGDIDGLIESQKIDVAYDLDRDGMLTLTGSFLDSGAVTRTVDLLEGEVFGLTGVTNEVQTSETYLSAAEELIARVQLSDLVIARLDGLLIEANGVVPLDKTDNWAGFMRAYSRQIAPHIPLRSFVTLEGQPQSAEPIILSAQSDARQQDGRVVPLDALSEDGLNNAALFASPVAAAPEPAPLPVAVPVGGTDEETNALVDTFAAQNPELVTDLLRSLTNGAVDDINALRRLFEDPEQLPGLAPALGGTDAEVAADVVPSPVPSASGATDASVPAAAPRTAQLFGGIGALLDAPAAVELGEGLEDPSEALEIAEDVEEADPSEVARAAEDSPVRTGERIAGFLPVTTTFEAGRALDSIQQATGKLFSSDVEDPEVTIEDDVLRAELLGVSAELVGLANAQTRALSFGETLIAPPAPLSAEANVQVERSDACWPGASITLESLPTVLLWMDILSLSSQMDVAEMESDNRLLFLEAGLNPQALSRCLADAPGAFAEELAENSAFLQESIRNDSFSEFIFRNVTPFDIRIKGSNLNAPRYVQVAGGRKLREGSAPDSESRVVSIGELGVIVRVADGYRVTLYPETMSWQVAQN